MRLKIEVLYEDDDLLFANKPPNILSIPDRFNAAKPNLFGYFNQKYGEIFVVHRLDLETSGVMVFAKSAAIHQALSQQFENRTVEKKYLALLDGKIPLEGGEIDHPIAKHPTKRGKMTTARKGKSSLTVFQTLEYFKHFTLVEAWLKTGRMHQARVHFKSLGFPLAIDPLYGRRSAFYLSEVKKRKYHLSKSEESERPLMSRTTLHAQHLSLIHPSTQQPIAVEAPLPKDFKAILQQLRKWDIL